MSSAPIFIDDTGLGIYWLDSAPTIGYLPVAGSTTAAQLSLQQAWLDATGVYLLFDAQPVMTSSLLADLRELIARLGFAGSLRFVWLAVTDASPSTWALASLQVHQAASVTLSQSSSFQFAPYSLLLGAGSLISLADESADWGFTITAPTSAAFLWQGEAGQFAASGPLSLPFAGPTPGSWIFQLPVADLSAFGVGLSYFYEATAIEAAVAVDSTDATSTVRTGFADKMMLPIFAGGSSLTAVLDPCQPLNASRSAFYFATESAAAIPSFLASPRGHAIALKPLPADGNLAPARLVFQAAPIYADAASEEYQLHIVPDGVFEIDVSSPNSVMPAQSSMSWQPQERVMCGMSGLEYIGLPASACRLVFAPGYPAFAPGVAVGVTPSDGNTPLISFSHAGKPTIATTAWLTVLPPSDASSVIYYFSQPEQAPLFGAVAENDSVVSTSTATFLSYTELPSIEVSAGETGLYFPLGPYRGIDPTQITMAKRLESAGLSPARRIALTATLGSQANAQASLAASAPMHSVSPQGLIIEWDADDPTVWRNLTMGNDVDTASGAATLLQLTNVHGPLRSALQTNGLMLVAANPSVFYSGGSVQYLPGPDTFANLIADYPDDAVYADVGAWYAQNSYPVSSDEDSFKQTLQSIPNVTVDQAHFEVFRQVSGLLQTEISGWRFQFSPWSWLVTGSGDGTGSTDTPGAILLMKFTPGKLSDFATDVSTWTWQEVARFNGSTFAVQEKLLATIAYAREQRSAANGAASPYDYFLDEVVDNPNWSGVLVLDCQLELTEMPGPLQCLAAGIQQSQFVAHHLGWNATAMQVGSSDFSLAQTAFFGLIDYADSAELHLADNPDASFAYKVQSLTVQFSNSAIVGFTARVALLIPQLFASTLTMRNATRGNSILLDGVFQQPANSSTAQDGSYVFRLVSRSIYDVSDSVISTIEIDRAEFGISNAANSSEADAQVTAQFRLGGKISLQNFTAFDVLSYGPSADGLEASSSLEFSNLFINLSFPLYDASVAPVFSVNTDELSTNRNSIARQQSLFNRFPISLAGLIGQPQEEGALPGDLGYVPADTPIANSRIVAPWWGIVYEINLGSLGSLAGSAPLVLSVLAAWNKKGPRDENPPLFIGVRMPGLGELVGASLPFESFLRMGFRNVKFTAYDDSAGQRAYLLQLRRFSIGALGVSFPSGNLDVTLFGDPEGDKSKVGWYTAYAAESATQKSVASALSLRQSAKRGVFGRE